MLHVYEREILGGESMFIELPSKFLGPDDMQSGFGVNFLFLARRTLGKVPANFSANFDGEF